MDMIIGDWDRHEDNWKWAMFKEDDEKIYYPIPKDRDHVFSKWGGFVPSVADLAISNAEDFGMKYGNMNHLNFKARYLDRELAGEISLEIWLEAAAYLQEKLTDEVIDGAVKKFPEEVYEFHADEIRQKLKSRRDDISEFIKKYYKELNKEVYITGTNKDDHFEINRLDNGAVRVVVSNVKKDGSKGKKFFEREIEADVAKKIYCFGLDGEDIFNVNGNVSESVKIRIIGGKDEDIINDASSVGGSGRMTQVYDSSEEDKIESTGETVIKRPSRPAHYDPYAFDYDWLIPMATMRRSSGNGFGFGVGFINFIRGFNKPGFAKKWNFGGVFYPNLGAYRLDARYQFRHFVGLHDLVLRGRFSTLYDRYPFFYGIGNDTEVVRNQRRELNRIDYDFMDFEAGLTTTFAHKSTWSSSVLFERHEVKDFEDISIIDSTVAGFGTQEFAAIKTELNLDFTDNSMYPQDGAQFNVSLEARSNFDGKLSSNIKTRFSYFKTLNLGLKTTFVGSLHYKQANGNSAFYHLSKLGSTTQFRGYTRNRFIDKHAMLYNSEARILLGTVKTPLIQFIVGVFGFYDGGRVWNEGSEFREGNWNNSWGGGFFLAPGKTDYTLSFTIARPEDDFTYTKLQLGFDF